MYLCFPCRNATHHGTPLCSFFGNAFGIACVSLPNRFPVFVYSVTCGQADLGSFSSGVRSWPCISHGGRRPAAAKNVGGRSTPLTATLHTWPAGTVPGRRTISGERRFASYGDSLCRKPYSPMANPWSEVNTTSVF